MDPKTLIIAALTVSLAVSLSMALVYWTRRTYPGFGCWVAGPAVRTVAGLLLILPRDTLPPWLTIILPNWLLLVETILYVQGTRAFRGDPLRWGWTLAASLGLIGLLAQVTYVAPDLNNRIVVISIFQGALNLWMIPQLLSHRPDYFGSSDRWQAGLWGLLALSNLARGLYFGTSDEPIGELLALAPRQGPWILLLIGTNLLIALSQIIMNAQRLEYDYRAAQRLLEQARDAAQAANRAKSEFLAQMSHEVRTPMHLVLGLTQLLAREPLAAHQRELVERIRTAGRSLQVILDDILDFSKIKAGQLRIERQPFRLGPLLTNVEGLMAPTAQSRGLRLQIAAGQAPPDLLLGDRLRLEQVLVNLLGNAVKFTERGEVALAVETVAADPDADPVLDPAGLRLRFSVRDTGIGIDPAALDRLFRPFTQAEAGTTRRYGGTGLGLAICKRLVEAMGGTIGAESRPGEGSRFWFELPFARAAGDAAPAPVPAAAPTPTGPRLTGRRLLVVDDSAMNRDLLGRALAQEGAAVTPAADGQQAVQLLRGHPGGFDAVLMDVRMPVMDGLTATRLIRGELGLTALPVIALTAGVLPAEQEAARAAGVDDILPKPLDLERLAECLVSWIGAAAGPAPATLPRPAPAAVDDGFPPIPGIDPDQAAHGSDHNPALFLRVLRAFTAEFADTLARTRADLERGHRDSAARRMHTLRGAAGQVGAMDLMDLAGRVESAILRDEPQTAARLDDLDRRFSEFLAACAPWCGEAPARDTGAPTTGA